MNVEDVAQERGSNDVGGASLRDHSAGVHGDEVVGVSAGLVDVVQHHHDGPPALAVERAHQLEHVELVREVQVGGGLVEQEHRRLLGDDQSQPGPLALPAGQRIDGLVRELEQIRRDQGLLQRRLVLGAPLPPEAGMRQPAAAYQVADGDAVGRGRSLGEQAELAGDVPASHRVHRTAFQEHRSALRDEQSRQGAEQG